MSTGPSSRPADLPKSCNKPTFSPIARYHLMSTNHTVSRPLISEIAVRMNSLRDKPKVPAEDSLCTLAVGAIYAASTAHSFGYQDSIGGGEEWGQATIDQAFRYC